MSEALLSIRDLELRVGRRVLAPQLSLKLAAGSRTALIGPNGAGKSTLLKHILGLLPYQQGQIAVAGQDIARLNEEQRSALLAYVPQQSQLHFPVPVADVVAMARFREQGFGRLSSSAAAAVDTALSDFGLQPLRQRPFTALSGGEQRRVLLARAAASEAPLVLLDEPMAHLDVHHIQQLRQAFLHLQQQGKTLLMVLHDLRDVDICAEAALVLGDGQLHGPAALEDLVESGVVQKVYGVSIGRASQYTFERSPEPPP